jgi:hypothetical protein
MVIDPVENRIKFLSKRKFTGIEEEIYGDRRENLRESKRKFTGIEEKIYRDRRENLRGSKLKVEYRKMLFRLHPSK